MAEQEEIEFTPLQDKLCELLDKNDIDEILWDTAFVAFSTDESLTKAIEWLKEHPDFEDWDVSQIIGKFGVGNEEEGFFLTTEIVDDDIDDE
jgi:hypothetical protein